MDVGKTEEMLEGAKRPRRACTIAPTGTAQPMNAGTRPPPRSRLRPTGRVLIVHANGKPYGFGQGTTSDMTANGHRAVKAKASNKNDFDFSCADYEAMRDSGRPYSGDPRKNKLLPLPRPTYTEFIIRAKRAHMIDRLDFLYCPAQAARPPRVDPAVYEVVVWCGVSYRRFTRLWTPERSHFFPETFQRRALATLCSAQRLRAEHPARCTLGSLPPDLLLEIIASSAEKHESAKESYDDLDTVTSGARHLFLPAPGSSGLRDELFDAIFAL